MRSNRIVAVNQYPGEFPRCCGELAWVKYFHFLREHYYPHHDRRMAQEGELLFSALSTGKPDKGYTEYINRHYFDRKDADILPAWNHFRPDTAAFAANRAEHDRFDKTFFQQ